MISGKICFPTSLFQLVQALRYETPEFTVDFSDEEGGKEKEEEEEEGKKDLSLEATYSEGVCLVVCSSN